MIPETYVVDNAAARGLTTIACATFELGRAITGRPIIVRGSDGNEYCLRLMTADEALDAQRRALANTFPDGGGPELMSRARAEELTRPVVVES